jgi:thiol-disulfide isomerase/thioredoxin
MRPNFQLLLLLCIIPVTTHAQEVKSPSLNIGDPAPPLRVRSWIKGTPVQQLKKGQVYVVELWATWCAPCRCAMPHLSALSQKYSGKVTIIGIDIMESKTTSVEKVKNFVDSMGHRMDYNVAAEESYFMESGWLDASGEGGIPKSFVVNAEGRIAWIGHPKDLDKVLFEIVNNCWDIKEALITRKENMRLAKLDDSLNYELIRYTGNPNKQDNFGKPDSALIAINKIISKEPKLKYAPLIAFNTFSALLKTDLHKAYEYGKVAIVTSTYEDPSAFAINGAIEFYSDKLYLPVEIYQLGAEAYQIEIDQYPYPELVNISRRYHKMAECYWRANDKSKAIDAEQKAIESLKSKKDFSKTILAELESRLQQYNSM